LGSPKLVCLDCSPADVFTRGHLPSAQSLPQHVHDPSGRFYLKKDGSSRLVATQSEIDEVLSSLAVGPDSTVVVYDEFMSLHAARIRFVLRLAGVNDVRILNGGFRWWSQGAKKPVATGVSENKQETARSQNRADDAPHRNSRKQVVASELLKIVADPGTACIVDCRTPAEFHGSGGHYGLVNARLGRLPGAVHFEWTNALVEAGPFTFLRPANELEQLIQTKLGSPTGQIITYCQTGIRAAHTAFVIELMGRDVRMYDGSFGEWSNDIPNAPITK